VVLLELYTFEIALREPAKEPSWGVPKANDKLRDWWRIAGRKEKLISREKKKKLGTKST